MIFTCHLFIPALLLLSFTEAFLFVKSPISVHNNKAADAVDSTRIARHEFMDTVTRGVTDTVIASILLQPSISSARGRATLEQSYDRYAPRIIAGGTFYKNEFKKAIEKNDWVFLKTATSEPPPRTKEDRAKPDGGISERASKAGGFSDARVLVAADLFAATFSDNAITAKTKAMQTEVEKMRQVVKGINLTAKVALGEEKPEGSGGFFGLGAKVPSQAELAKQVRDLYVQGGTAFNQYAFYANEGLPIQLNKFPYL